ncbi:putative D-lactate dehydrogenase [Ostertagia ostertagi]
MKVAVFSTKTYDKEYFDRFNPGNHHELTYFEASLRSKTAALAKGSDAICLFVNDKADAATIQLLSEQGVRLITLRCAGFNNVDLEAAARYSVKITRVPAYSPEAVAEHAVALILTLNRKTHKAYNRVRESNFSLEKLLGFNLHGKTVGVVGTGKIGQAFIRIMLGFGCRVIAYDKYPSTAMQQAGVTYMSFDELLPQCDIISLHCPLLPETHHLMNAAALSKMKKGTMLINTSRGAVINTADAIEALKNSQLGYLGIDVSIIKYPFLLSECIIVVIGKPDIIFILVSPGHLRPFVFMMILVNSLIVCKGKLVVAVGKLRVVVFRHIGPDSITKKLMIVSPHFVFNKTAVDEMLRLRKTGDKYRE